MRRVFVDTGAWVAVCVQRDNLHIQARQTFLRLVDARVRLLTSDFVVDETLTRLRYGSGHRAAMGFLHVLDQGIAARTASLVRVTEQQFQTGRDIFERHIDQKFSFTDCTSFAVARAEKVTEVFTYDHHFAVMGFVMLG